MSMVLANDRDENERVDSDVSCNVDQIVHQATRNVTKWPPANSSNFLTSIFFIFLTSGFFKTNINM